MSTTESDHAPVRESVPRAIWRAVIAHLCVGEIGHTLHWPHSYYSSTNEYDNPGDLMSGFPTNDLSTKDFISWHCAPQNTLALNRFAAGWIGDVNTYTVVVSGTFVAPAL